MTDEERKEMVRLSQAKFPDAEGVFNLAAREIWKDGYAAACEAKREDTNDANRFANALGRERARFGNLALAVKAWRDSGSSQEDVQTSLDLITAFDAYVGNHD